MAHLQLKDIPDGVHGALRVRARRSSVSMCEHDLRLIERDLGRPDTPAEMLDRLRVLPRLSDAPRAADLLDAARDERERR